MSFKRDGNDVSLLNRLRSKRVVELLGEYIPEDEAKLLSNGRLTCLVCRDRPIFDTVSVLSKHRQGKKHIFELKNYIQKNEQLELQKIKKEQQIAVENCRKAELFASKVNSSVIGPKCPTTTSSSEYKPFDRRKMLEVPSEVALKKVINPSLEVTNQNSQLKKYLKTIKRRSQFQDFVEKEKSTYSLRNNGNEINEIILNSPNDHIEHECKKRKIVNNSDLKLDARTEFSRNLSGWIKDKTGNWMKDPEAEFDSDEEDKT